MTYLIDSDVMIDFFKLTVPARELLQRLSQMGELAISAITVAELRTGWNEEEASRLLPRLYALCLVEGVTKEIAELAGMWRREYKLKGQQLTTPDTLIAATTHQKGYCLVTKNGRDYPMPELDIYEEAWL